MFVLYNGMYCIVSSVATQPWHLNTVLAVVQERNEYESYLRKKEEAAQAQVPAVPNSLFSATSHRCWVFAEGDAAKGSKTTRYWSGTDNTWRKKEAKGDSCYLSCYHMKVLTLPCPVRWNRQQRRPSQRRKSIGHQRLQADDPI